MLTQRKVERFERFGRILIGAEQTSEERGGEVVIQSLDGLRRSRPTHDAQLSEEHRGYQIHSTVQIQIGGESASIGSESVFGRLPRRLLQKTQKFGLFGVCDSSQLKANRNSQRN